MCKERQDRQILCMFASLQSPPFKSSCSSVRPPARTNSTTAEWVFIKLESKNFRKNCQAISAVTEMKHSNTRFT